MPGATHVHVSEIEHSLPFLGKVTVCEHSETRRHEGDYEF